MVSATRTVDPLLPTETGTLNGLVYTLWLPEPRATAGVVVVHGAGSCKESHHDFARVAVAAGLGAICFDQRGHGESAGPMDGRAVTDVTAMVGRLRDALGDPRAPVALRGSSMGGYLAIVAAPAAGACAVVAICPAGAGQLRRGLRTGEFEFAADVAALDGLLAGRELDDAVDALAAPLLILHAEGDERVPVAQSRELEPRMTAPGSRLIVVPGGHHRSIQHDPELQAVSVGFLARSLARPDRPFVD